MSFYLNQVKSAKQVRPRRTVLYGVHGVGKSTWAAQWPSPVFVPTEDGIADIDVPSFPLAKDINDVRGPLLELSGDAGHGFETVVIDSADWTEKLIWASVCSDHEKDHISDFGYGKGYAEAASVFQKFLKRLNAVRDKGMHIVVLAHASINRFEDPEGDTYDRYQPKLHRESAALLQEWADEVLFACYKTFTVTKDEGFNRERHVGTGTGRRVIKTTEMPAHNAKNRLGLKPELPLDFDDYKQYLDGSANHVMESN